MSEAVLFSLWPVLDTICQILFYLHGKYSPNIKHELQHTLCLKTKTKKTPNLYTPYCMLSLAHTSQPIVRGCKSKSILMSFFARLYGSYEDLQIGQVSEALVDFTGGVNIRIKLPAAPPDLWDILTRATYSRSLMCCQTQLGVRLMVSQLQVFPVKFSSAELGTVIPRKKADTRLAVEIMFLSLKIARGFLPSLPLFSSLLCLGSSLLCFIYQKVSIE